MLIFFYFYYLCKIFAVATHRSACIDYFDCNHLFIIGFQDNVPHSDNHNSVGNVHSASHFEVLLHTTKLQGSWFIIFFSCKLVQLLQHIHNIMSWYWIGWINNEEASEFLQIFYEREIRWVFFLVYTLGNNGLYIILFSLFLFFRGVLILIFLRRRFCQEICWEERGSKKWGDVFFVSNFLLQKWWTSKKGMMASEFPRLLSVSSLLNRFV